MTKSKKAVLILAVIMVVLMLIPTFNYEKETFTFGVSSSINWGGSISNFSYDVSPDISSNGIENHNESVVVYGINGYKGEKYGSYITAIGVLALLALSLRKIKLPPVFSVIAGCLPIIGILVQVYGYYTTPRLGTFNINQPLYVALIIIAVSIAAVIVSIKGMHSVPLKEESPAQQEADI